MGEPLAFLIVEDDDLVLATLQRWLKRHGPTRVARTLAEAEAFLPRLGCIRGILLDLALPDGSGISFLSRVRELHPTLEVTIFSGHITAEHINAACDLGAFFLAKTARHSSSRLLRGFVARTSTPSVSPSFSR